MAKRKKGKTKARRTERKKRGSERKKRAQKEERFEGGFEEVIVRCASCGREFRIVKSSGFSTEGMLCQRCSAGGGIGPEEEDDY